ncbi:MAG: M48 family metalloprotease [Deltaproteobacteria bacterium]|nr:M48 family metalloprotease [Deltaproteobacteria bacterium]
MLASPLTAAELADIRAYEGPRVVWFALSTPVQLAVSLAWLRWLVRPLYAVSEHHAGKLAAWQASSPALRALASAMDRVWRGPGWGAALLFALYDLLLYQLLFLPVDVYLGYVHEHAHGLSNHTPGGFAWDLAKGTAVHAVFTALLAFGLFGLARRTQRWWLLLGIPSALALLGAAALDPLRGQLYFEHAPLPPGPARESVERTLRQAGVEATVVVEHTARATRKLQAYFAGQGATRTVVLNDALLEHLSPAELSAAVAHEAGHLLEPRWPRRVAGAVAVLGLLWLAAALQREAARRGAWGIQEPADIRTLPAISAGLLLLTSLGEPLAAWQSRRGELAADRYALELTQDRDAFAGMLVKAARVNKVDPAPPRWRVLAGMSHPPISERLAQVTSFKPAAAGR